VRHEPESLTDVECGDDRCAHINRPEGVIRCFQVERNTIEPSKSVRARNLFTKADERAELLNELEPRRPKVARIVGASAFPGRAERLAGAGSGPGLSVIWPASESERIRPSSDAGEEMALVEASEVSWLNKFD
jgi:hypothetical protein